MSWQKFKGVSFVEEVLFDWGYNVTHSERESGIIIGEKRADNRFAQSMMIAMFGLGGLSTPAEYEILSYVQTSFPSLCVIKSGGPKVSKISV